MYNALDRVVSAWRTIVAHYLLTKSTVHGTKFSLYDLVPKKKEPRDALGSRYSGHMPARCSATAVGFVSLYCVAKSPHNDKKSTNKMQTCRSQS
jgi:hypothetical protein